MNIAAKFIVLLIMFSMVGPVPGYPQEGFGDAALGSQLFAEKCVSCHQVDGRGIPGVYPALKDLTDKSDDFIRQTIKNGRPKTQMQSFAVLGDDSINNLIAHLRVLQSGGNGDPTEGNGETGTGNIPMKPKKRPVKTPAPEVTQADITRGQEIFQGIIPLQNGGPTCISCHHVDNFDVISGGSLGKDLTTVYTRLTHLGVKGILSSPPFPVMRTAYKGMSLTKDEIRYLIAFLKYADRTSYYQETTTYGGKFLVFGFAGALLLFVMYSLIWFRRKKNPVNQDIYNRQTLKSE
ncbi:MAG: c-type cytochrome [bacterium]|nr:c-type cytochrome [bacterium]